MKHLPYFLALMPALCSACLGADADDAYKQPVANVADGRLELQGNRNSFVPMYASMAWGQPRPEVTRVVAIFHGRTRNAAGYFRYAQEARAAAHAGDRDTLIVAPQFLAERDLEAHGLGPDCVRWKLRDWDGGADAIAPAPVSSFDVIDALLAQLADAKTFPNLRQVVLAGHSGGGQILQRHAAVGLGGDALAARGVKVRYVVSNPSSYLYFTDDRPAPDGKFRPPDAAQFPGFNLWKYGLKNAPRYVRETAEQAERRYTECELIYLLGEADSDPALSSLDKSPAAEAQGASHYTRGLSYAHYMQIRHPGLAHRVLIAPGVGHDAHKIFTSPQGLAALFDVPLPER